MVQQWAHDIRSGFYRHNSKKNFTLCFINLFFHYRKSRGLRVRNSTIYYSLASLKAFYTYWNSWKLCVILIVLFLQTSLWKFKETRHCTTWYLKRRSFEFTHIRYVICRNISEIYLKIIYAYNSTICDINRLSE